ncbi:YdeI/OmpD-associated family protein [Silvibacterium acidisoli]|uniref:YdeI/OmpD-associated family protein n=1 Tax=Acidobacteriaceae bacterium ZG23-2 TaxID=2883246 RepID=UPI00406D44FF
MPKSAAKTFKATLVPHDSALGWTIVRIPRTSSDEWKTTRHFPIKGSIQSVSLLAKEPFAFRSSVFPDGKGGFFLLVRKDMQKAAKVTLGSTARFSIEPDEEKREYVMPPELSKALTGAASLKKWFEKLPPGFRKYVVSNITASKSAETRQRRAERMAEILYCMKEAETELPPILEAAFIKTPKVRKGWELMTPIQRRGHIWGIFNYQSPESRQKRTDKAVEEAIRIAESKL